MVQKSSDLSLEIVLLLLRGDSHVRGISRQLNESHSTVIRRLDTLMKENVLDYKIEGKNKVFSLKKSLQAKLYVFNAERHKFIELIQKYPKLGVIIDDILKKTDEKIVILFGSYAKFIAKNDSDIDIYVDTDNRRVVESLKSAHTRINVKIGRFDTGSQLIREIIKNHVILRGVEEFYEKTGFFRQA